MFTQRGNIIKGIIHFSPNEVRKECAAGAILVDLRRENEIKYKSFDVNEIIYASPKFIKDNYEQLPIDKPLIFADNAGLHSREVVEFLIEKEIKNVANLAGGMFEWDSDNMPVLINNKERLGGSCLCVMRKMK